MKQREDWLAIGADILFVAVFAWIGRASHGGSLTLGEIALTALPFAVGALITHLVLFYRKSEVRSLKIGVVVWLGTWLLGLGLRAATGAGLDPAFIGVAGAFLALMILGWRLIYFLVTRSSPARED